MIKVPAEIQVRIVSPQPENAVPRFDIKDEIVIDESEFLKLAKKLSSGGAVGIILGVGIYLALQICGVKFGGIETSIVLGIPLLTGLLASYVIF
ncbi:MAG: hypothetical protein WC624_02395 [Candidatus Margulisiibacteriota bacterium]